MGQINTRDPRIHCIHPCGKITLSTYLFKFLPLKNRIFIVEARFHMQYLRTAAGKSTPTQIQYWSSKKRSGNNISKAPFLKKCKSWSNFFCSILRNINAFAFLTVKIRSTLSKYVVINYIESCKNCFPIIIRIEVYKRHLKKKEYTVS